MCEPNQNENFKKYLNEFEPNSEEVRFLFFNCSFFYLEIKLFLFNW